MKRKLTQDQRSKMINELSLFRRCNSVTKKLHECIDEYTAGDDTETYPHDIIFDLWIEYSDGNVGEMINSLTENSDSDLWFGFSDTMDDDEDQYIDWIEVLLEENKRDYIGFLLAIIESKQNEIVFDCCNKNEVNE